MFTYNVKLNINIEAKDKETLLLKLPTYIRQFAQITIKKGKDYVV